MSTTAIVLFVTLLVFLVLNVPVGIAIGMSALCAVLVNPRMTETFVVSQLIAGSDSFPLMAIPLFILAGELMASGGVSKRILNVCNVFFGRITGGLAIVTVVVCMFFAAVSGSGPATVAAVGSMVVPTMLEKGYSKSFTLACVACAGCIGVIIPPSIPMVIYGTSTGASVSTMFMAGFLPGIMIGVVLCLVCYFYCKKMGWRGNDEKFTAKQKMHIIIDAIPALIDPIIILGGIYGGFFTPTESAVIAVVYGMLVCLAVYREISGKTLWDIIEATATGTANLMILVVTAQMFGWLISYYQIPQAVSAFMLSFVSNKYMFWAIIIILLTICGMFLEVGATNLILGPILAPIAGAFGIDPVHFGLVFVFLLAMGQATPPFGTCMFVSCGISQQPVSKVSKELIPFVAVEIACAVIFALVPAISTFLPSIIS